jgi:hypothetical protein
MRSRNPWPGTLVAALIAAASACAGAISPQEAAKPSDPAALVRAVVQNEMKAGGAGVGDFYTWKERSVKPSRTTVKQYVETPDGLLARLVTIDDKPLSDDDRTKEDARINRLLDPRQMQQKRKQQKEDENRTKKMVGALPDAFLYKQTGTEEKDGRTLVKLHFTPNPNFNPPSRETLVYQGMEGDMVIDSTAMRLLKIDGTMMRDVSIGWGIIGHLDKGGHFEVEQSEVDKGDWEITSMRLNFTGKALIFKTIRINEADTSTEFRKIPKMKVAEAIDYLKKAGGPNASVAGKE